MRIFLLRRLAPRHLAPRHPAPRRRAAVSLTVAIALGAVLALSACASSASTTSSNTPAASGTAAPAATSTRAPAGATTCAQLPGFAQAGPPPQAGAILGSIPFPANSVFTSLNTVAGNTPGLYAVAFMNVCTPNTAAATVKANFASQLPGNGWTQSSTYPYDGGYQAPCGDPYCWSRSPIPNFLSLEKVTDAGNGLVTYGIRLAIPPSTPDCSNIAPPGGGTAPLEFFWSQQPSVPVPPLSAEGLGDGHGVGSKTVYSQAMCSPGTAASVKSFMSTELANLGYAATNQSLCGTTGWVLKNGLAISWNVSDPLDWSLSYCQ
jgi:hypothetical protein